MSVPKKGGAIGTTSGSLSTKRTDDTNTKIKKPLKKRKMVFDESDEKLSANYSFFKKEYKSGIAEKSKKIKSTEGRRRLHGRCGICRQNLQDSHEFPPASLTCGHSFCRRCILIHLERQDATGKYTCSTCSRMSSSRPALVPYTTDQYSEMDFSIKLAEKHQHKMRTMAPPMGEDDNFLMRHKASLKRMIELHGEGITKAGSHFSRMIQIINCNITGEGDYIQYMDPVYRVQEGNFTPVSDIFKPKKRPVRTVVTQGVAGIGKTTLVHKFITDWIDGKANEDVDFVFMLPFWKLNLVKDLSCSLHKLLLNFHPEFKELADLKQLDGSKVIVILDGMDEGQFVWDFQNNKLLCDITEASSVDTLVTNIIKGNLLPFAKVWITLHPLSTKQIPSCYINRMTEILPFSDSEMEECVRECINDVTEASNILQKIKISKHLHGMCHHPVLCKIAVNVVKSMLEQGETKKIQTCTELYSHFLLSQVNAEAENKSSSEQVGDEESGKKPHSKRRKVMLRFSELALRHLMKNSLTFSEKDLKDHDIDVSDTASLSGIFTEINQENQEFIQEKVFCFTQSIILEFLAALCVFYAYNTKNMGILQYLLEGISQFEHEKVSLDILLKCVIDKVLDRMCRHQYFLRFLAGMSLESSQILLQALLTNTSSSSATTESILKHIKNLGKQADVSLETCLNLLHCRIEMQDLSVTEDFKDLLRSPRNFSLSQLSEITTLVQMTEGVLDEINLQNCHPSKHNMALEMFLSYSRRAILSNCRLSFGSCKVVASALQQPHCSLRELDMSGNDLRDSGAQLLGSGLKSPNCKLEILRLSNCELFEDSCKVMASALQHSHCSLRELDMSGNNLRDSGVQLLCTGLKSPNCKLEILRLSRCWLYSQSCLYLNTVLKSDHCCLRELDVSHNHLKDADVNLLTKRLRDPNCKLKALNSFHHERPPSPVPMKSDQSEPHKISFKHDDITVESRELGGQPPENRGKVEDMCYSEDRECNGDVQVFTPVISASERTTYRFICSSAGVHQCRYTGLIFKTDMAAEVQYQTVCWDYKKLDKEGLVAAGPLFKMKGLQGTVRQLGFPHCEIMSSDAVSSLSVIHIKDSRFEKLQPDRTSDTHVFLNIAGFCKFGLAKKRCTDGNVQVWTQALVLLFLDQPRLNVFLLPRNTVLSEVFEKRRQMTHPRNEIYIDTPSKCKLFSYEDYCLTCSSEDHIVSPESAYFDVENYEDYYPTFQVALSNIEPIRLYLNETKQNENGNKHLWKYYVNLQDYQNGGTKSESTLWSPYTPLGKDFFHKHRPELEKRLGLLTPILSELEACRVLNAQEREAVENIERSKQNRTLLLMLEKKGGPAQEEFYRVLLKYDEYLVKHLKESCDVTTGAEYPCFLRRDMNSSTQKAY